MGCSHPSNDRPTSHARTLHNITIVNIHNSFIQVISGRSFQFCKENIPVGLHEVEYNSFKLLQLINDVYVRFPNWRSIEVGAEQQMIDCDCNDVNLIILSGRATFQIGLTKKRSMLLANAIRCP